jgi:aldose sugar dehydrogenase
MNVKFNFEKARLIILPSLLVAVLGFLLSHNSGTQPVQAFSAGPPAGYAGAPGEEPEACAECHVVQDAGTGHFSISAPQTYIPGQTYQITVTHTNTDLTRRRWGFELTALDTSDEKAGDLQSTDVFTQVLNNQGPAGARQYIEHTSVGTFPGQQNGASWTFNWTAPPTDVGFITFYAAGNQANNDGNTSGDNIYKTFVGSAPASATPDFSLTATPSSRNVVPGESAQYALTAIPLAGFNGVINLNASGLPAGANATFNPATINLNDATSKTSTLTITTSAGTPLGNPTITITATSGALMHTAQVVLQVVSPASIDLSVSKSASPNPGEVGTNLTYRITVTNNGPAQATIVTLTDTVPAGVTLVSASATQGTPCTGSTTVNCALGTLAKDATATVSIIVTPSGQGQVSNTATATAAETDFATGNNSSTINTLIQPAATAPSMLDPNLTVSTLVSGLDQPTSMAFLGANDFFVLEKASGKVQRIVNGKVHSTALDLAVNSASERGLLGIALHPQFPSNGFVFLYWTQSTSGADSTDINDVGLLGNRIDRYVWNGSTLTFDRNLIRLRAFQLDAGQTARGNHNGGVLRFGQDGKLYALMGDNGRRGWLQNLKSANPEPTPDDQFGGPEPDDAHLTGLVLRLNDDGTTPADNPFAGLIFGATDDWQHNLTKLYAYGVRNGFGMAFDPLSGNLWTQENGDDAFDEMNRVQAGFNGGWAQIMGPVNRIAEFKSIESSYGAGNLQQLRWPPTSLADTPQAALARLYMLPGARYTDPEFSWKYAVAPAAIGFVKGRGLGQQFEGDMFVGASRTTLLNGYLFRFKFTADRQHFAFTDPNLADRVADNSDKFDIAESESLVVGRDFGVATDIQTGPNGNVFVVSISNGAVYQIAAKPFRQFQATLTGGQEVPANNSTATGTARILLDSNDGTQARLSLNFAGLPSAQISAHIHGPAPPGMNASVAVGLPLGQLNDLQITLTAAQVEQLKAGLLYINVHSTDFPNGEIRGQFLAQPAAEIRTWTTQGRTFAFVKLTFPDGSYRVVNWGQLTRTGNDFTVDPVIERTTGASLPVSSDDAQIYDLGPLTTGSYTFTLKVSGVVIRTQDFIVTSIPGLPNPIDDQRQFVRQQYIDFLNREPDQAGWDFWTDNITKCSDPARRPPGQTEAQCIDRQRETTSAAFFLSPEFLYTGYYVHRFYKGALARPPKFSEFIPDSQFVAAGIIVSGQLSAAQIEANKVAFANLFVNKPEFVAIYGALTNAQYVDKLFQTTTINASAADRAALVTSLDNGSQTRATVLQKVVDGTVVISEGNQQFTTTYGQAFYNLEFNPAFVEMEYFGYLRRDPDAAGYAFWLAKLNLFGNYLDAEMVKAFITSPEYRSRFGQP